MENERKSPLIDQSMDFAVRIVNLYKYLRDSKYETVISKQVLRSGTSIGANVREGSYAQSKADFRTKMNIALKEANETDYWIELLYKTEYISENEYKSLKEDCRSLLRMLISTVKKTSEPKSQLL